MERQQDWLESGAGDDRPWRRKARRTLVHAFASVWLVALSDPLQGLVSSHPTRFRLVLGLAGAAVFAAVYLWQIWYRPLAPGIVPLTRPWIRRLPGAILTALSVAMTLASGQAWMLLFIFAAVSAGIGLESEGGAGVAGVAVLAAITGSMAGVGASDLTGDLLTITGIGLLMHVLVRLTATVRELRVARAEVARLAVSEERLRFARDLHDLLGHSLSLIALKSELAGRLTSKDPDRAAAEIQDVERVARSALHDVRAAVAGYRQPSLAAELRAAGEMLAAAGIAGHVDGTIADLSPEEESVLAWTVREGVTNVIRHSRARHCTLRLSRDAGRASVEVIDDGRGPVSGGVERGSGLRGLAERVAALEGQSVAGRRQGGGFRLAVALPAMRGEGGVGQAIEARQA